MDEDEQKRIVRKIYATVYKQLHQQFVIDLCRTKCDIDFIYRLWDEKEFEKSSDLVIAVICSVKTSRRHLDYLEYQLSTLEEKEVIPEEIVSLHRKEIQQFRRHYSDIDRINRERAKYECV